LTRTCVIFNAVTSAEAIIGRSSKINDVILSFKESEELKGWITDFRAINKENVQLSGIV
jgi:hypothetical protein